MDGDDQGKLFVGGISFETTEDILRDHFSKYGQVGETVIMKDRVSGNARGFAFVLFSDPSSADQALLDKHLILSRTVEVKKALPRGGQRKKYPHSKGRKNYGYGGQNNGNQFRTKKIFVGGLSASVTEEEFKAYFEKFGRIEDVVVMYDSLTHRPRGFGFITFDSEEAVENVMQQTFHVLNNKSVEVKRAVPKDGSGLTSNGGNDNNFSDNANTGVNFGGGSIFGRYNGGVYPPFSPRYNVYTGYAPHPIPGYAYGAYVDYPVGGYGGVGFGPAPRSPWNVPGMVGVRRGPMPYGNAPIFPGYMGGVAGGFMGMPTGDYHGVMRPTTYGKWNQDSSCDAQLSAGASPMRLDSGKPDNDSSVHMGHYGAVVGKQGQKGPDEPLIPCTVSNSS